MSIQGIAVQVLEDLLHTGLRQCVAAARMLQHDACQLLDARMICVLLGTECSMPREVKLTALALVFTVSCQAHGLLQMCFRHFVC
jgi:hypothetical protein